MRDISIHRLFILIGLLFICHSSSAGPIERPAKTGWGFAGELYSSPGAAGAAMCFYGVDHMIENAVSFSWQQPTYSVWCSHPVFPPYFSGSAGWIATCDNGFGLVQLQCIGSGNDPDKPNNCPKVGNPINPLTGVKSETHIDYSSSQSDLSFVRHYTSHINSRLTKTLLGVTWRTRYETLIQAGSYSSPFQSAASAVGGPGDYSLTAVDQGNSYWVRSSRNSTADALPAASLIEYAFVQQADGSSLYFSFDATSTYPNFGVPDSDVNADLIKIVDANDALIGWRYRTANDEVMSFDASGKLMSIESLDGDSLTLHYDLSLAQGGDDNAATLDQVTDDFSNSLLIAYDTEGRINKVTSPEGNVYQYHYNENGILDYVSYPDDTPDVTGNNPFGEDNPVRQYHYEHTTLVSALTGITDERGARYAAWDYDDYGRAIMSKHEALGASSGVDQFNIDYQYINDVVDPRITVTNSLEKDTTYHYSNIISSRKLIHVEGHASTGTDVGCAAADQYTSYDTNGFKDIVVDWEGKAIDYDYDSLGREVQRVEGLLAVVDTSTAPPTITTSTTPESNTIQTEWHPDLRLPTKITEPDRVIVMTYDPVNGRELSRTEYLLGNEP